MKHTGILLCVILFFATYIGAEPLSFDAFVHLVKDHNRDLRLAEKDREIAGALTKQAYAAAYPIIGAEIDYSRNFLTNYLYVDTEDPETGDPVQQKFQVNYNNDFSLAASVEQTVFSFKVNAAIEAAKQYEQMTDTLYNTTFQAVLSEAKKMYYQTLLLYRVWQVSQAAQENAHDNFLQMQNKFDAGLISELKLLQAKVRWKDLVPDTTQAWRNYQLALNTMKTMAGIEQDREIALSESFSDYPAMPEPVALEKVLERRPDYNALLWQKKLEETNIRIESAELWPSVSANVVYSYTASSDKFKLENDNNTLMAGIKITIPIFTGGYTSGRIVEAELEAAKTDIELEQFKENVQTDLSNIYLNLKEAHNRIDSASETVATAEKAYQITQASADNGLATQLELKDARLYYDQAQLGYYQAMHDYLTAYFDWQYLVGAGN